MSSYCGVRGISGLTWALCSIILMSCSPEGPPERPTLPEDAYGYSDAPLPPGAVLIQPEEFKARLQVGDLSLITPAVLERLRALSEDQASLDSETIDAFRAAHPNIELLALEFSKPDAGTLRLRGDGNFDHYIRLNDGTARSVVTMGPSFIKRQLARAMRVFPTRDNQLRTYRVYYEGLSDDLRVKLDLASPEEVEMDPERYNEAVVRGMNDRIVEVMAGAAGQLLGYEPPKGYEPDCTREIGYAGGSDSRGGGCGFQATGIRENFAWPMKFYVTCVKAQRGRGTCTCFANTSAIESMVAKQHGLWVNLSEQAHYNRMKLYWERKDFGDGFNSDRGFEEMIAADWIIPFESLWPYNPSIQRDDGIRDCTRKTCEQGNAAFVECSANCSGEPDPDACIERDCRGEETFHACADECAADPKNHHYIDSCIDYGDTCSETTHQSEEVCIDEGFIRFCAFKVPNKNTDQEGYRITTFAQLWDATDVDTSLDRIKTALAMDKPVVIGFPVTTAFDAAHVDGFVDYVPNDTNRGGHGMHAVGYIDNGKLSEVLPAAPAGEGGGYLIVKNSWGSCWGDGGYAYIPYQSIKDYTPDATLLGGVH